MIQKPDRPQSHHDSRAAEQVAHEAANFIAREAGLQSLITVTRAVLSSHGDRITVFVSVFPEDHVKNAISFLERQRSEFSEHLKKTTRLRPLPRVEFMPDNGEKNRQRLDELSQGL